ncbi:sporulation protein [Xylanimonas oleitrophica]|uniref:Sporulation protein n=1 Tax=Xylanimonas oleitrophica TaxID=2607479 RepID=A0A2W5WVX5_9MICO|nr:sporulation protein [Xylanimonas oleitrophica]PZR55467.1 sporulation protein [Xylanimonas oleitrophica]
MASVPDLQRISQKIADGATVRDVFGAPVERDGTLLVPVARVWSSGGGGGGDGTGGGANGSGGGLGLLQRSRPVGAYVLDESGARWEPAVDVTRIVLGGQAALAVVALAVAWAVRRRRR